MRSVDGEVTFWKGISVGEKPAMTRLAGGGVSDTTAPTVAITSSESSPTAASPIPITVTFSEEVTGFVVGDLTVGNGTAGDFATADNIVFTANITPTAAGAVTVDIAPAVCQDAAGNNNTAATQFSIVYAPTYAVEFAAGSTTLMIGSEVTLDDIQDNAFTVEGWFKITDSAAGFTKVLVDKVGVTAGTLGWGIGYQTSSYAAQVPCVTTTAQSKCSATPHDSTWHHIAMTWDDAGDRIIHIFIDGVEVTYSIQVAGVGAIKSDAAFNAGIGTSYNGVSNFIGRTGWVRISNIVRYTGTFTPDARAAPPVSDANTIRLFKMDEGTGTNINDSSSNAQDGTLTNGTWVIDP